ncbi:toll/interleukin-1 receptor domain-containing protein [Noviherbaspirillum sp. CPCC 100848]|uniref:Toll/interleukin-1 receptor domain-containing protein n=1 Tax=Noviherbaspirillum album TaxID=3080276 RepID=A0ABU6JFE9_9BURK|nr:toll/interleukin-1 receptor domain-containing protein [Noviherbaspirillum sp. CPCC 100848]MEC4722250.1 toll/interleukin-1 receptor domain-containing protein [Noviherbaspirillum sp. CPCC 100848]
MATVFFSYSHVDEALRDKLEEHLSMLKHQGLIESWHDRRILAGSNIDDEIDENLEKADVILLLVSSSFIASSYCYGREMKRAMERPHEGTARVIPVILRTCDWHPAPFGKLLGAPKDGKAVTTWPDQDEAFTDVAR